MDNPTPIKLIVQRSALSSPLIAAKSALVAWCRSSSRNSVLVMGCSLVVVSMYALSQEIDDAVSAL